MQSSPCSSVIVGLGSVLLAACSADGGGDVETLERLSAKAMAVAEESELTFSEEVLLRLSPRSASDLQRDDLESAVHWRAVLSFVPSISRQQQQDVLNSLSFAQAAAGGSFPGTLQEAEASYGVYLGVLKDLGWTVSQSGFQRYSSEEEEFRMDRVALKVIGDIATSGQVTALTSALQILESLPEDAEAVTLFEKLAARGSRGLFEVGSAEVDSTGFLSFCMGGFYFEAEEKRKRFLFFPRRRQDIAFWMSAQCMTLNGEVYSAARPIVIDRLKEHGVTSAATTPLSAAVP